MKEAVDIPFNVTVWVFTLSPPPLKSVKELRTIAFFYVFVHGFTIAAVEANLNL